MATKYTLYFSDTGKTPFDLQSYTTNGPESPSDPAIIAGATGAATTLKLWGKGLPEYGEPIFQNLVYMLENFAGGTAPVFPIEGQLWYNNATAGSPPTLPKLLVNDGTDFDTAAILSNGASAMTGELLLANSTPSTGLAATSRSYVQAFAAPLSHTHPTAEISDITTTSTQINLLGGGTSGGTAVSSNVQDQLDDKVSRTVDLGMALGIDLSFNGGEVRGLPNVPLFSDSATSMRYVDDQVAATLAASGDGVLTGFAWANTGLGSPIPDTSETTLRLTVTQAGTGSPPLTTDIDILGVARSGHVHPATEVSIDSSFDATYGANTQTAIERAAEEIELLKTGGAAPTATIAVQRIFEVLAADLTVAGSPIDTFTTQNHTADDNRVALSINGIKQYAHSRGTQSINYSNGIDGAILTGLNNSTIYEFNITVDGGGATTIIVDPTAGSPAVDISTHGGLVNVINTQLTSSAVAATFSIDSLLSEIFTSHSSGAGSAISITDPVGANTYLFAGGSPLGLDNFVSVGTASDGVDGDYMETDSLGVQVLPSASTSYVVFNYDILTGSKIESLLYV